MSNRGFVHLPRSVCVLRYLAITYDLMTDLGRAKLCLLFVALIERIISTNETTVDNQELRHEKRKSNKTILVRSVQIL